MRRTLIALSVLFFISVIPCRADDEVAAKRFSQTMMSVIDIIAKNHFTPISHPQLTEWAIEGLYKHANQPIKAGLRRRIDGIAKAKPEELTKLLHDARVELKLGKEQDKLAAVDICLAAISQKLEPAARGSEMIQRIDIEDRVRCMRGAVSVGLKLEVDPRTKMLRVEMPYFKGPAYLAGMRPGDIIQEIRLDANWHGEKFMTVDKNGKQVPLTKVYPTKGMSVDEANYLLQGLRGTTVRLIVIPAAQTHLLPAAK